MLARTRRNRVAILVSLSLVFTSTCAIEDDGTAMQRSGAASIVYAAAAADLEQVSDVQAGIESDFAGGSRDDSHSGADTYLNEADSWKADLFEYDNSLQLISYKAVHTEPDDPLITTTVTTDARTIKNSQEGTVTTVTTVSEPQITARQTIIAEADSVVFYSSGYGHGVGMSQNGANFYAMYDGWSYDQILSLYYPGTVLVQTGTPETELMTVGGKTDTVVSILSQICNNEMGPTFSVEALKAQAVAAYTYYLYNGYGAGMICKPNPSQKIVDAVREVLGIVVYYDNAPALTSFYASSGGATANCRDIFCADIPYLRSIPVRHDESSDPHFNSTKTFSSAALKSKLESTYHITLSGNPYDWIQLEYGDGGYVAYAVIGGQVRVKGNDLRGVLGLKSPKYEFVYQPDSNAAPAYITTTEPLEYDDPSVTHASVSYLNTGSTATETTFVMTTTETETTVLADNTDVTGETIQGE